MSESKTRAERIAQLLEECDSRLRECHELWVLTPIHGEAPLSVIAKAKEACREGDRERRSILSRELPSYRPPREAHVPPGHMVVYAGYIVGMQGEICRLRAELASMTMHAEGLYGDYVNKLADDVREKIARLDRIEKAKGEPS